MGKLFSESGLVGQGITIRIRRFLVQTLLGAKQDLETQPSCEAPDEFWVEVVTSQ